MTGDLLSEATRALRDATQPSADGMEEMLARLPVSAARGGVRGAGAGRGAAQRRRRYRAAVIALAATFMGLGAWARMSNRLPAWFATEVALTPSTPNATEGALEQPSTQRRATLPGAPAVASGGPESAESPVLVESPVAKSVPQIVTPPQPNAPAQSSPPEAVATPPSRAVLNAKPKVRTELPTPSASALGPGSAAPTAVDALYRDAHRVHFTEGNFGRALELWDEYLLRAGSGGRMLIEARFNRAIALVRLGRSSEARAALKPFAEGQYGGYRRDDALRLLESLEGR